jgi:hypothetical protein
VRLLRPPGQLTGEMRFSSEPWAEVEWFWQERGGGSDTGGGPRESGVGALQTRFGPRLFDSPASAQCLRLANGIAGIRILSAASHHAGDPNSAR